MTLTMTNAAQVRRAKDRVTWECLLRAGLALLIGLVVFLAPAQAQTYGPVDVVTRYDQSCAGFRYGGVLNCTAKEFTVSATLNTADGTPPFCAAGSTMTVDLTLSLTSSNTDRYDFGIFVGKGGNDPGNYYAPNLSNAATLCTTGVLPTPPPSSQPLIFNAIGTDTCGDLRKTATSTQMLTMRSVPVYCDGGTGQNVAVPYLIAWGQNTGDYTSMGGCTPDNVRAGAPSKCQSGTASVNVKVGSNSIPIQTGGYIELTKQTLPDGDTQPFTFTASAPNGAYLGYSYKQNGTYGSITPVVPSASGATTTTLTLTDDQTVRVYMSVTSTARTLSLSEAATTGWETSAQISCTNIIGAPTITPNAANRSMTASMTAANAAAACTFTNTKSATITLTKNLPARLNPTDQFRVSATTAGSIVGTASATTAGTDTSASTTFKVTPYTAASPNTVTLTDTATSGVSTNYTPSLTCTSSDGRYNGTLPTGLASDTGTVQPTPGGVLTCAFTNRLPTLSIRKTPSVAYLKYDRQADGTFKATPGTLTYTVTVTNADAVARSVTVTDALPAGLTDITVKDSAGVTVPVTLGGASVSQPIPGPTVSPSTLGWSVGDMSAGTTRSYTVTATLPNRAAATSSVGAIQNTAILNAVNQIGAKQDVARTDVIFPIMSKTVQNLTKGTAPGTSSSAFPGETLRYCISAANRGSVLLNNYVISDTYPSNTSYLSGTATLQLKDAAGTITTGTAAPLATSVSGKVAALAPNDTVTLCFDVKVN